MLFSYSTLRVLVVLVFAFDHVGALHSRLQSIIIPDGKYFISANDSYQRTQVHQSALVAELSQRALLQSLFLSPTDARRLHFGNVGKSDEVVSGQSLVTNPCDGADPAVDAMPYIGNTSNVVVHRDFDIFPAELINEHGEHCLIRSVNVSRGVGLGSLRAMVDFSANNKNLACAEGEGSDAPLALPGLKNWTSPTEQFQYILHIPSECKEGGSLSPCPLLTALHGVSDFTVFGDNVLNSTFCEKKMGVILLMPKIHIMMKGHHSFEDFEFLRPFLLSIHTLYAPIIDKSRLYLYGQSMGASGALYGGLASPDLFTDVFSISPQHMWIQSEAGVTIVAGDPTIDSVAPKWKERSNSGVRRLRRMIIVIGGLDAVHPNLTHDAGIIPRTLAGVGLLDSDVNVEIRFYPTLGHVCWIAAFNGLYDAIWLGRGEAVSNVTVTTTASSMKMVWILVLLLAAIASMRFHNELFACCQGVQQRLAEARRPTTCGKGHLPSFPRNVGRSHSGRIFLDFLKPSSEAMALVSSEGKEALSHAELYKLVSGTDLSRFGIPSQTKIATLMPPGEQSASLLLALFNRYAVAPLSAALQAQELSSALERLQVKALLTTPSLAQSIDPAIAGMVTLIEVRPFGSVTGLFELTQLSGTTEYTSVSLASRCNGLDDIVLLLQTSGTTSVPKVVPVTLHRLVLGAFCWGDTMDLKDADVGLNIMPHYHIGGIVAVMLPLILNGGGVVCAPNLRDDDFVPWVQKYGVTYYAGVPTMHQQVLQIFETFGGAPSGLALKTIATGAAHTPHELLTKLREAARCPIVTTYGMTECMPIAAAPCDYALFPQETVGKRICSEVACFAEDGTKLVARENGELCVRGQSVMKGYLSGGEASYHVGGWFRTGDLCTIDKEGWIFLLGRSKEVINRGGELISPFEVDSVASQHPAIRQCISFSAPHRVLGEAVAAVLVVKEYELFDPESFRLFMLTKLSVVKVPEAVVIVPHIPKGPTGKPERLRLAQMLGLELGGSDSRMKVFRADFDETGKKWNTRSDDGHIASSIETDSLGFARKIVSKADDQEHLVQQALYGLCAAKLIWQHWLPADLSPALPFSSGLCHFLKATICCRTCLVLIFPLLGYFDGRRALAGESHSYRVACMLAVYVGMSWPYLPALWGFATLHRWPIAVWLYCMGALLLAERFNVPAWIQVSLPFAIAPLFGNTMDSLHERLGFEEHPERGVLEDPTFLLLEHKFYWSVGAKIYFIGCYMLAYHYLAPRQEWIHQATTMGKLHRILAFAMFVGITALWEKLTPAKDLSPAAVDEISDWPEFFGTFYPLQAVADWLTMLLLVIAVGAGNGIMRLMGASILGTMICHMYIQLPLADLLHSALLVGGAPFVLLTFCLIPVIYTLTVGFGSQFVLLTLGKLGALLFNAVFEHASSGKAH